MGAFKGAIVQKVGMSRVMDEYGQMVAVTLLEVVHQRVTKILTKDHNGYDAYQVGYFRKRKDTINEPNLHRLGKCGVDEDYSRFREFRPPASVTVDEKSFPAVGTQLDSSLFQDTAYVDVSGLTKGRGFQGVIKRWKFRIAPMSHGSRYHRRTGSLGNCTTPGRVMPGKKLPGRYGNHRRTLSHLKLVVCDQEQGMLAVKGAVPGNRGSFLEVRSSRRQPRSLKT